MSNNGFWRDKSDRLDKFMGWEGDRKYESGARGLIHGVIMKQQDQGNQLMEIGKAVKLSIEGLVSNIQQDSVKQVGHHPETKSEYELNQFINILSFLIRV